MNPESTKASFVHSISDFKGLECKVKDKLLLINPKAKKLFELK